MKDTKAYANFFKALGDDTRLRILMLLMQKKEMSVTDLAKGVKKDQSTVYRHIMVLESVGIIKSGKQDKFLMCCLSNCRKLESFIDFVKKCREKK